MQSKQAVWPLEFMNLPAAQLVHVPWPTTGCTVPGLHGASKMAPVEQKDPAGHMVH